MTYPTPAERESAKRTRIQAAIASRKAPTMTDGTPVDAIHNADSPPDIREGIDRAAFNLGNGCKWRRPRRY